MHVTTSAAQSATLSPSGATAADTSPTPVVRLTRYDANGVLGMAEELIHLETAARVPADADLAWLPSALAGGRFSLLTASVGARLVGFVAGCVQDGAVRVERLVVAAPVLAYHPEVPEVLLSSLIDDSGLPWADVFVPRDFAALQVLLDSGWTLTECDEPRWLRLSAAHLDKS